MATKRKGWLDRLAAANAAPQRHLTVVETDAPRERPPSQEVASPPAAPPYEEYLKDNSADGWIRIHILVSPDGTIQPTGWSGTTEPHMAVILAQKAFLDASNSATGLLGRIAEQERAIAALNARLADADETGTHDGAGE